MINIRNGFGPALPMVISSLFALLPDSVMAQQRSVLPDKVTVLVSTNLSIPASIEDAVQPVPSGTEVTVKSLHGDKLRIAHGLGEGLVEVSHTDLAKRAQEIQHSFAAQPSSVSAAVSTPESAPPPASATADDGGLTRISAKSLSAAYTSNELAADQEFKGKTIIVTGRVHKIAEEPSGEPYVMLEVEMFSLHPVRCFFPREQIPLLTSLASGQSVSIKGEVEGKGLFIVALRDCSVVGRP